MGRGVPWPGRGSDGGKTPGLRGALWSCGKGPGKFAKPRISVLQVGSFSFFHPSCEEATFRFSGVPHSPAMPGQASFMLFGPQNDDHTLLERRSTPKNIDLVYFRHTSQFPTGPNLKVCMNPNIYSQVESLPTQVIVSTSLSCCFFLRKMSDPPFYG